MFLLTAASPALSGSGDATVLVSVFEVIILLTNTLSYFEEFGMVAGNFFFCMSQEFHCVNLALQIGAPEIKVPAQKNHSHTIITIRHEATSTLPPEA